MYLCMMKTMDCFNGAERAIFPAITIFALIRTSSALCIESSSTTLWTRVSILNVSRLMLGREIMVVIIITWITLNVLQGQTAVIFKLSLTIPLTFTGLNIRTVIAGVTWSNRYLHRMFEQDHFGRVHFKVTKRNTQIGKRINCLCAQH